MCITDTINVRGQRSTGIEPDGSVVTRRARCIYIIVVAMVVIRRISAVTMVVVHEWGAAHLVLAPAAACRIKYFVCLHGLPRINYYPLRGHTSLARHTSIDAWEQ